MRRRQKPRHTGEMEAEEHASEMSGIRDEAQAEAEARDGGGGAGQMSGMRDEARTED